MKVGPDFRRDWAIDQPQIAGSALVLQFDRDSRDHWVVDQPPTPAPAQLFQFDPDSIHHWIIDQPSTAGRGLVLQVDPDVGCNKINYLNVHSRLTLSCVAVDFGL